MALKQELPFGGTPGIAVHEAFLREVSTALELIIKAVIAMRIEAQLAPANVTRVRTSHDVLSLWESDAGLPVQPPEDRMTLALAYSILRWAGRYAAPTNDGIYEEERQLEEVIAPFPKGATLKVRRGRSISWDQFDRLYSIASREFWRLHATRWGDEPMTGERG